MSSSGYRGRNFGPRGARTNGPPNGYSGPRFPHPTFNCLRPLHRLPGHEKWIEGPNFSPWQQNNNFLSHLQYRGNLQFRPNGRGRAAGCRGIVRFSGPGRPPASQFCIGYKRNPIPRASLPQEELIEDKSTLVPQIPLLGSEEERQQKISETADKLKQKLSSITAEELTNFWEDDLSILSNHGLEEDNIRKKGIPELRHEPPELDLTFTDFRDIGRVDCNNSKFDNVDNKCNDEISVSFRRNSIDKDISTNNEIIIIDEDKEYVTVLDSVHQIENFNPVNVLLGDDKCAEQMHDKLSDFECNIENLQDRNPAEDLIPSNTNNESSLLNVDDNITNLAPLESVNLLTIKQSAGVNNIEATSALTLITSDKDELETNFAQDENTVQIDTKDENKDVTQDITGDAPHDHYQEIEVFANNQNPKNVQTNVSQKTAYKIFPNIFESCQNRQHNLSHLNKELHLNTTYDTSTLYSTYNEVHKLNDDQKFSKPVGFQPKLFSTAPRFASKIGGTKSHWTYPQNGKNVFFRGPLRLPFHGNRISSSKHVASFQVGYDPRTPPSFSSTDLLPVFDPSEPPPNIRPTTEMSNRQNNIQSISVSDSRSQTVNSSQNHMKVVQALPAFDPRGPPPRISNISVTTNEKLPEFNPQQPPPKIQKREDTLQPPPIFDPRLSSRERSNLIAPLDSSRSKLIPMNLVETSQITDYGPVVPNFSQVASINMPTHQTFITNVQMNFQPILSQTNSGHTIMRDFALPPPPMNITEVPPPPPKETLVEGNSNPNQSINMDDGLEDMQEAMEFAQQIMNMTEKTSNKSASVFSKVPLTPTHIPVPNEGGPYSLCAKEENISITKKQKKKESKGKRGKSIIVYEQELIIDKQKEIETVDVEQSIQNQSKIGEDALLSNDQIRPKVVFNLNSKTKKIHKPEEWHRAPINISENKDTLHQSVSHNINKTKIQSGKNSSANRRSNLYQNKNKPKESNIRVSPPHNMSVVNIFAQEKSDEKTHHRDKCLEKSYSHSLSKVISNNTNIEESQKVQKDIRKADILTLETSWKNRVISRFLKMSKNDICNMVNNSSLRKFDIAMKHLVKERKTSLSLEMRNTEDEKMKEYDREEFMTQLNAMLDPSAIVAITDLPTEFIHHLSEVLQLDRMPFDTEHQHTGTDEIKTTSQNEVLRINTSEYCNEENPGIQPLIEYEKCQNISKENREIENEFVCSREKLVPLSFTSELNLNHSRDDTSSSQKSLTNKIYFDVENSYKKQQQPLFNEADLDDILSEVTEKTKNLPNTISLMEVEKTAETCTGSSLKEPVITEVFERNTFSQVVNKTAADLDDIFSAGIARVKLFDKNNVDSDNSRLRKSTSEDRSIFRSERYERWNRKEQEDADTFRNLTKEEWEAKYGATNSITIPTVMRKSISNSAENLSRDNSDFDHRSNSPIRHVSLSPLTREASVHNSEKCNPNEAEDLRRAERSESSSDFSSTSSSDSNEETVAPNVTKLLKVIKEKEKIAKKKSLNETIRDEVAAEIEKKWKEKSKYKERKSRKRERRKKDKKDKRKKEKRKLRKRSSYSDSSKSCEQLEAFPLLTEDKIKKEVIVKEEPMCSFENNIQFDNGMDNSYIVPTLISRVIDTQSESQNSQVGMEEVPAISHDSTLMQCKNKLANVSMSIQPKTKAQLKQMPEANKAHSKQVMEESANIQKNNSIMNTPYKAVNSLSKVNTDTEIEKSINEGIADILSTSIFFNQSTIPFNIKESSSNVEPHIETICVGSTTHLTLPTSKVSNFITELNSNNQCAEQKTYTNTSVTENKAASYKKIDIKAYKQRTLQRRLKEQAMLKENPINSTLFVQDLHSSLLNETNVESITTMNETLTIDIDKTKLQSKDPRLSRIRLATAHSLEDSNQELKIKPLEHFEHQPQNVFQENAESVASVEIKSKEENIIQVGGADLNICIDSTKYIQLKTTGKSSPPENACDFEAPRLKDKSDFELENKNSKKPIELIDSGKFKNIRSEGGKELKLKKEKVKKSTEKKKKEFKSNESKSLVAEKHLEKYSCKVLESNQEPLNGITNITVQTEIEKVDNSDISGKISKLQIKSSTDGEIIQEQIDINFVVEQDNCNNIAGDEKLPDITEGGTHQVNEKIIEKEELLDKKIITSISNHNSQRLENKINTIKQIEINSSKITELTGKKSQPTSTKNSNEENNVDMPITPINSVSLGGTEKCEDTEFRVSNYVSEETFSLSEHVAVDIEKNTNLTKIECLQNVMEEKSEEEHNNVKCVSHLNEFVKDSGNCSKVIDNEARSPDSPSSPFKGFLADSVEDKTCQVSQSYNIKMNSESDKENLNYSKLWLETCFDNKFILQSTTGDKDSIKSNFKSRKEEKRTSLSNLMQVQKDDTERMNDSLDITDSVNITGILDMEKNRRLTKKDSKSFNIIPKPERSPFAVNIDSQDVYDEESEPFIILDEYIDDTDGKSIEKLSALDLDLEECIARDADIFTNKSVQGETNLSDNIKSSNFNTVDFKELSVVLDQNNVSTEQNEGSATNIDEKLKNMLSGRSNISATDVVSSTSESNIESYTKFTNSIASERAIESSQNIISTTSKDSSQRSVMPELSSTLSKRNMDCSAECSNKTQAVGSVLQNKIPLKLTNSVKCGTESALDLITNAESFQLNKPNNNKQSKGQVLKNSLIDGKISATLKIGIFGDKDTSFDSILEREFSKNRTKVTSKKSSHQENNDTLRKIKSRSKMKHKKQKCDISAKVLKKVVNSDIVNIRCPSTKEAIMARMIEIDVEIHKLMTEKMTLYQMLTSGALPTDNNLQHKNVIQKENAIETAIIRPGTPSALMSQLLQNIETNPVSNECTNTAKENTGTKDSSINSIELNQNRIEFKHCHHTENKGRCTSSCDFEGNKMSHQLDDAWISRKKHRPKLEKIVKKSQNKLDITMSGKDMQHTNTEKKRINDLKKSESKKVNPDNKIKQSAIELEFSQVSINDTQSQKEISKISEQEIGKENSLSNDKIEASKSQEDEGSLKSTESRLLTIGIADIETAALNEGNCLLKDSNEGTETSNKKNTNVNSSTRIVENRTPEKSIYSDDSTWDSLLQMSNVDDQKKPSTGLALLEETYRKEMAKTRRVKAEVRKKKKRLQGLEHTMHTLTPEEEELPLSALYIKKFHQRKNVQNSMDQQTKQQENDDPQLWKNLDDVINAVAENRTGNFYVQTLEQASQGVIQNIVANTPNPEENFKSREDKEKRKINPTLEKAEEDCSDIHVKVEISYENKSETSNDSEIHRLQLSSNKSQEFVSNKDFPQNLGINVSSKFTNETLRISVNNKSTNIEMNAVEFSKQQTVESNNAGNNQCTSAIGDLDVCLMMSSSNSTQDNQKSLNIAKSVENAMTLGVGKVDKEDEETNVQTPLATIEKTLLQESTDSQLVIIPENVEQSIVVPTKLNKDKDTTALSEFMSKEQSTSDLQNVHEDKATDSSASIEDNNLSNTIEEQNDVFQDEHFISLKSYKESQRKKETDHCSTTSSEESSNQNSACCTFTIENADVLKNEEVLSKKLHKRKRGSSRTPLRRSSRYAEEPTKRIKLEIDTSICNSEQELQEKNTRTQLLSISPRSLSPCEEVENLLVISKKSRGSQKTISSRKRCTPMPPEIEIISHGANANNEFVKGIKRYKQHTISEMMNCVVQLVDCRHTILNLTASPDLLQKYGISKINTYVCSNSTRIDSFTSSVQLTSIKDLSNLCIKEPTSVTEFLQVQTSKLLKKSDNTTQSVSEQINSTKIRKILKSTKMDSFVNDEEEYKEPDIEFMPVLAKEPVIVDILQNCEKPDIEIVEEKNIITKNQQHTNSGLTLTVIDTKDDKELPRTQYTVHKGPILDIKVFENSFLAASEDGRVYRYNQTSNGILNIYKGHTAAVTCLYVYNASSTDVSKEWMFSGSLDGTLQCYNIVTGVQTRGTADIGSPIQCMDEAWGTIFIGTKSGHVSRYHIKSGTIKGNSIQFSDKSVLALKATNEGPRRVLIVASRSQPITIRDAQSGLFLRTICGQKSHTVYSLMRDTNLIYCGTSSTSIPVFDFTNGEQTMQYDAGVGIVCMRLYKQLLFAGCYDGNIYVFNTQDHRLVCSIPGPGNMLLSMEVIGNKIIAGSKDKRLQSWQMPGQVRSLL